MELKLYDTLTRKKRVFTPIDPARVRMYVCGPTVYDFAHIGNARPVIVFDVLFRLLRHLYGPEHVTYVRNVTDVDDKINARAAERGVSIQQVTQETYKDFKEDVAALGCLEPTVEPRATQHIAAMKEMIERLVKAGCAYVAEDHVLFNVASMADYGKLSRRSLDEMIAGARVEVAPYKKAPMDFVLWKPSKPGEPAWASPAGIKTPGRPGWHIECSAMADYWLWEKAKPNLSPAGLAHPHQFDIHGGGIDLVFPHHENEIAQSRCAFHTPVMANYWMHNGFLQVEGEKMAKSAGNFVTIRDLIAKHTGDEIRLTMLKSHYRQPVDWRKDELARSQSELRSWGEIITNMHLEPYFTNPDWSKLDNDMFGAFCDDLNTPLAISRLHDLAERSKQNRENGIAFACNAAFFGFQNLQHPGFYSSKIAGYVPGAKSNVFRASQDLLISFKSFTANNVSSGALSSEELLKDKGISPTITDTGDLVVTFDNDDVVSFNERVRNLIAARSNARKRRDWKESDRIRDELAAMGVVLKDSKEGTTWEIAR